MNDKSVIHTFNNGVRVFESHLLDSQKERYAKSNVHEEDEEEIFIEIIRELSPGDVFVNVGTAIGYYPILSKKIRNDIAVHCFEPLGRHLEYLRENMELNGFLIEDFSTHHLAVSHESGEVLFIDNSYGSSLVAKKPKFHILNFLRTFKQSLTGANVQQPVLHVKSIKLSQIFQVIQSNCIKFLQMDIQGFELPVLKKYFEDIGGAPSGIQSFLVGTHSSAIHTSCLELFQQHQFDIIHDIPESLNQPDGIIYCKIK